MLRELISRFTGPGSPPPVLSQVSQLSQSQRPGILLANPSSVAKVATVAVAKVENPKIGATDQPAVECKGASAPGPDACLDWSPWPAADDDPDFDGKWAAFDLRDLCHGCGLRIVRAGERVLAVYPPSLDPRMIEYAEGLLDDARAYLSAHRDCLPLLNPTEAVAAIKEVMRQQRGLQRAGACGRCTRRHGRPGKRLRRKACGSRPAMPWTATTSGEWNSRGHRPGHQRTSRLRLRRSQVCGRDCRGREPAHGRFYGDLVLPASVCRGPGSASPLSSRPAMRPGRSSKRSNHR